MPWVPYPHNKKKKRKKSKRKVPGFYRSANLLHPPREAHFVRTSGEPELLEPIPYGFTA
jgi:hypothetical protein